MKPNVTEEREEIIYLAGDDSPAFVDKAHNDLTDVRSRDGRGNRNVTDIHVRNNKKKLTVLVVVVSVAERMTFYTTEVL